MKYMFNEAVIKFAEGSRHPSQKLRFQSISRHVMALG